jgi:hypothetical protein
LGAAAAVVMLAQVEVAAVEGVGQARRVRGSTAGLLLVFGVLAVVEQAVRADRGIMVQELVEWGLLL